MSITLLTDSLAITLL